MGSFELKVKRNIGGVKGASAAPAAHAAHTPAPAYEAPVALASLDAVALESIDESLLPVTSPKVDIKYSFENISTLEIMLVWE